MRKPRQYSSTGFYHNIVRGVNKMNIFYDNEDRKKFVSLLKRYSKKYNINIHSYIFMENHVHLQIEDLGNNLSIFMQTVESMYARYFNHKYDRIGHLFQERFASEVILTRGYFLTVLRYILQNAEKEGIAKTSHYKWSSYRAYRKKSQYGFIKTDFISDLFDSTESLYKFINEKTEEECRDIELRPSEKKVYAIEKIKKLLKTENPIIKPDLPKDEIIEKIKLLRRNKLSIRTISRITGISVGLIIKAQV